MKRIFFTFAATILLSACQTAPISQPPQEGAALLDLKPASFADLPGWYGQDPFPSLLSFQKSCERIARQKDNDKPFGPDPRFGTYGDWKRVCATPVTTGRVGAWFEMNFSVWKATANPGGAEGLFTGYYEAALKGSRTRQGPYQTPLRRRPADLVMVDLGEFREALKGQRIAGRVINGSLKPYEDHSAIDQGKLPNDETLPIVWVDDPVKAFFLQIQGSGRVMLENGETISLGYAGQNGHAYYAVGRELVKRGYLSKEDVTMQSIESWLKANPAQAKEILYTNPSYVFFEEQKKEGPVGGENVVLTPNISLAVDRSLIPYGVPVWLSVPESPAGKFQELMIAQDTGGAIRGPVRGDVFFGYGPEAEAKAGAMKAQGEWWFLIPKSAGD